MEEWKRETGMHLTIINAYFKKEVGWKIELQMSLLSSEIPVLERIRNTPIEKAELSCGNSVFKQPKKE